MGFAPRDVDDMTLWEFQCCEDGYRKAHSSEDQPAPEMSDDKLSQLGIEGF